MPAEAPLPVQVVGLQLHLLPQVFVWHLLAALLLSVLPAASCQCHLSLEPSPNKC